MDVTKPTTLAVIALAFLIFGCDNVDPTAQKFKEGQQSSKGCQQAVKNEFIVQWEDGRIEKKFVEDKEQFKKDFVIPNLEKIRIIESNRIFTIDDTVDAQAYSGPDWGQKMIGVESVWSEGIKGQNVIVGIVDTWVDPTHPQLKNKFLLNSGEIQGNGVDDDKNGYVDDYYGYAFYQDDPSSGDVAYHGTHVAGVVVAEHGAGLTKGVAEGAKIVQAPFLNNVGNGTLENALLALEYVKSRGAKVINASWGAIGCGGSQILSDKILSLGNSGILFLAAAGNRGVNVDTNPEVPAVVTAFNQITVAWSTYLDFLSGSSNYSFNFVHLAAPGGSIYSTVPYSVDVSGGAYLSGTSMATPFVSGVAALLWSAKPQASLSQIKQAILNSVDKGDYPDKFPVITRGRLNAAKALEEIRRLVP